jgi:ubiquinone/menaquinone biosynthesis C-methylase UbiE
VRGVEQIPWLYDAGCWLMEKTGLERWRAWLVEGARGRVLDLGCGTGRNLPRYRDVFVVGLDPSAEALAKARRRAPSVPLVRGSAEALPFREGAFDTVVSGLVFCSVPDAARGLSEVKRVLSKAGALRMLEHVRSTAPWAAKLQDRIQPVWTKVMGGCHPNRDTEATVAAAGFAIDENGRRAQGNMRRFQAHPVRGSSDTLQPRAP